MKNLLLNAVSGLALLTCALPGEAYASKFIRKQMEEEKREETVKLKEAVSKGDTKILLESFTQSLNLQDEDSSEIKKTFEKIMPQTAFDLTTKGWSGDGKDLLDKGDVVKKTVLSDLNWAGDGSDLEDKDTLVAKTVLTNKGWKGDGKDLLGKGDVVEQTVLSDLNWAGDGSDLEDKLTFTQLNTTLDGMFDILAKTDYSKMTGKGSGNYKKFVGGMLIQFFHGFTEDDIMGTYLEGNLADFGLKKDGKKIEKL